MTGTTSVTIERTVSNISGGSDAPPPPQPPQPPGSMVSHVRTVVDGKTPSIADAIRPETQFQVQLGISTIEIDGETIIHDDLRNTNHRLNASGSFIWSRISPQASFAELLASIRAEHDVMPDASDRMVAQFLADLIGRGVLTSTITTTP
jgi:hypothetical protein